MKFHPPLFTTNSPLFLALSSAILLLLSFPNFNQPWCAWIAFVPWLLLLRLVSARAAFWWSYLIGAAFFLTSMWWLIYVTVIGWLVLCAYLALYFGVFGWCVVRHQTTGHRQQAASVGLKTRDPRHKGMTSSLESRVLRPIILPSLWVTLEYARSHLLSGLGWNLLAYSQTPWRHLIQFADVTGAWGVSFVVVMGNVVIGNLLDIAVGDQKRKSGHDRRDRSIPRLAPRPAERATGESGDSLGIPPHGQSRWSSMVKTLAGFVGFIVTLFCYGAYRIPQVIRHERFRVAVVQGNIPQEQKWDAARREAILERYAALTKRAAHTHPQLIVWPETSVPGYVGLDEDITQRILAITQAAEVPMLVGAPMSHLEQLVWHVTNSAALVRSDGTFEQRYDKMHLVPFGEFIPFEETLPWLRRVLPPIGDFTPGREATVFHLDAQSLSRPRILGGQRRFSVLICFEDVFPELSRRFIRQGAQCLLVITNDAWFGPTAAAYQHAQASMLRAVELRVPVARAANTGWSGCIDPTGRPIDAVQDQSGRALFIDGTTTCDLPLGSTDSLYGRWGDWFAWLCLLTTVGWLAAKRFRTRSRRSIGT